jgi:hypothetical protein
MLVTSSQIGRYCSRCGYFDTYGLEGVPPRLSSRTSLPKEGVIRDPGHFASIVAAKSDLMQFFRGFNLKKAEIQ